MSREPFQRNERITYMVVRHRGPAYAVEITERSRPVRIVSGFKSRAEAESWITAEMMAWPQSGEKRDE